MLGVAQGAVSPLAVVNDSECVATLAMDKGLMDASEVLSHPLRNDRSVRIKASDLIKVGGFPKFPGIFQGFSQEFSLTVFFSQEVSYVDEK